jgi:DNA-binding SARP family transcriptional activator
LDQKFRLLLLGVPEMVWQGQSFTLPRRQARALLYYLAAELHPVPRDQLTFLLWPDIFESTARRNLTRLLSYLRNTLPHPDLLVTTQTAVALDADLAGVDTVQFSKWCTANEIKDWESAAPLYRGRFLDGFTLSGSPEFDQWLGQTQRRYERTYLDTLHKLVMTKGENGHHSAAIHYAQQYLATDDLAEAVHRRLINLYAANGDRSAALRQFEHCSIVLERELGVPPLPETRAAYEAARDSTQPPPPETQLKPEWSTLPGLDLPLIGRDDAWQALTKAYRRYQNGGVIFISGEAGVGKSRLMQEFATAQSGLVLTGNNHATGQPLPYQPLVQALRQALPLRDRWGHTLPIWLAEVSRLLPELRAHFPDLPPPVEVAPQLAQARLFEALTEVFGSLATDSPLLLCLDDVHWADDATVGWLEYVTKRLAGSGLCIMGTYRSHRAAALANWRRVLNRAGLAAPVRLGGLSEMAVAKLLHGLGVDDIAGQTLARRIHFATGGNAFFVLETIRELLETGQSFDHLVDLPLPQTVRDAVLRRAARLTSVAQQLLSVAAVLPPHLRVETLTETSGRGELETMDSLDELLAHHLLLANGDDFQFQHDVARQAVYEDIAPWRQQLLHRRAAEALVKLSTAKDAGLFATIAHHFEISGDVIQAIDYYRLAATSAQQLYAHQETVSLLQKALQLSDDLPKAVAILPELQEDLADNLTITGHFALAEETYRAALSRIPENDRLWRAEIQRKLAETLPPQQRSDEAFILYQSALTLLAEQTDSDSKKVRLSTLLGLMAALYYQLRAADMVELKEETQALLDEIGTPAQQARFYSQMNHMALLNERYQLTAETVALARSALTYAQQTGNVWQIAHHLFELGFTLLWHGDLVDAEAVLKESLQITEELGDQWSQTQCLVYLTTVCRMRGDAKQMSLYLPRLATVGQIVGSPFYMAASQANTAWLHYRNGQFPAARKEAEAAASNWENSPYPFQWLAYWILLTVNLEDAILPAAIAATRAILDPRQQKLPDDVNAALEIVVQASESGGTETIQKSLQLAVNLAHRYVTCNLFARILIAYQHSTTFALLNKVLQVVVGTQFRTQDVVKKNVFS